MRPPVWLLVATIGMAAVLLGMSVAETSFRGHYLIDQGEYLSLVGLAFILGAGLFLHRRGRLFGSLALVVPWLLYPVITQGDQIIDNLPINAMRWVVHILLAFIFATPVVVIVLAVRQAAAGRKWAQAAWASIIPGLRLLGLGRSREGTALLVTALLVLEMWLANVFLGTLMIVTLVVVIFAVLIWGWLGVDAPAAPRVDPARRERIALATLVIGVVVSGALYLGFKNRPGAYQGSPSFYMDPGQAEQAYDLGRIHVPAGVPSAPRSADLVRAALDGYGRSLEKLLAGYYILDRNYNYHFHNELFLRSTPLLANYRQAGLGVIAEGRAFGDGAAVAARDARATLGADDPLAALLDDVTAYASYSFGRAETLERMSGEFERTKAGLQHATHIYEGEGKFLGVQLASLVDKHHAVFESPALQPVTAGFARQARAVFDQYANRIVGF